MHISPIISVEFHFFCHFWPVNGYQILCLTFFMGIYLHCFRGGYTLHMVRIVVSLTGKKAVNGYTSVLLRMCRKPPGFGG